MIVWEMRLMKKKRKEELVQKLFVSDAVPVVLGQSPSSDAIWDWMRFLQLWMKILAIPDDTASPRRTYPQYRPTAGPRRFSLD
jgi:hypothetical protein